MDKVWIVTSGQYSDYGIEAVFATKEDAEEYVKGKKPPGYNEYNDIEEWALTDLSEIEYKNRYTASINFSTGEVDSGDEPVKLWIEKNKRCEPRNVERDDLYSYQVSYVSQEHANKLAVEARQRWLREFPQ